MSSRHRPANRRSHETIAIEHEGQRYKVGLGRDVFSRRILIDSNCPMRPDSWSKHTEIVAGPIIEVFLNAQKANSPLDVLASDGAILMSLLLQYGCPPDEIFHSMKRMPDGSPASPLGRAAAYLIEGSEPC